MLLRVALVCALPAVAACASAGRSAAWEKQEEGGGAANTGAPAERVSTEERSRDDARELRELFERAEARWAARDDRAATLEAIRLWEQVVEQVESQGLALGTHAELPPERGEGGERVQDPDFVARC